MSDGHLKNNPVMNDEMAIGILHRDTSTHIPVSGATKAMRMFATKYLREHDRHGHIRHEDFPNLHSEAAG